VNQTVAILAAGLTAAIAHNFEKDPIKRINFFGALFYCNCLIMSMVAVAASATVLQPASAFFVGMTSTLIYIILAKCTIFSTDPLKSVIVHGIGGIWGLFCAGTFAGKDNVHEYYGPNNFGWILGGGFQLCRDQMLGIVLICSWIAIITFVPLFFF